MSEQFSAGIVGLDVGGANLKAYALDRTGRDGTVRTTAFALWKQPERLGGALVDLLVGVPGSDALAVTMTAELCDCYQTKRVGVGAVLDAVEAAAGGRRVLVWQTDGRFVDLGKARERWEQTAAANWLASATYAGRFAGQGRGMLIDVGSTTTDIIPMRDGVPVPQGRTDPERLASGELIYSGVRRTPICALVHEVPWRGQPCAVAAEWFATTHDVYLLLGELAEDANDRNTADGRPATRCRALERLARVVCADGEMLANDDVVAIARAVSAAQMRQWQSGLERVVTRLGGVPETVVVAGEGEFLARRLVQRTWGDARKPNVVSLADELGARVSHAACAYAVAVLAQEQIDGAKTPRSGRETPSARRQGDSPPVVVKVGGSLLDLDDLPQRLRSFLRHRSRDRPLLVVGGGRVADAVRDLDRRHRVGDEAAHWLAVRAMSFNARLLAAMLSQARIVDDPSEAARCWEEAVVPILDPWEMLQRAERDGAGTGGPGFVLPHGWEVTSDSIAAWVARRVGARELVLLKSAVLARSVSLEEAVELGLVDGSFDRVAAGIGKIVYVNLRAPAASRVTLEDRLSSPPAL